MKPVSLIVAALLAAVALNAGAAELSVKDLGGDQYQLILEGEIAEGDSDTLMAFIYRDPLTFVRTSTITLNSPGGSVAEAIKLAVIVERSAFATIVEKNASCASSCVLIYVGGQMRMPSGSVLVHRPYLSNSAAQSLSVEETRQYQENAMTEVRRFLESRFVPRAIVDMMMTKSSVEAERLSVSDLKEIGLATASFEETSLARCGASPDGFVSGEISAKQRDCIKTIMTIARLEYLNSLIGKENARPVWDAILEEARAARD